MAAAKKFPIFEISYPSPLPPFHSREIETRFLARRDGQRMPYYSCSRSIENLSIGKKINRSARLRRFDQAYFPIQQVSSGRRK